MSEIFNATFEGAALYTPRRGGTGFMFVIGSNGSMEVTTAAAHDGTYGVSVTPGAGSSHCFVGGFYPPNRTALRRIRQRIWINPNGIAIPSGSYLCIARSHHPSNNFVSYKIWLNYLTGTGYRIQAGLYNGLLHDQWIGDTAHSNITNAWHRIEWYYQAGLSGSLQLWVDGTSIATLTGDLTDNAVPSPAFGNCYPGLASISGTYYLDSLKANDDGSEIGA